MNGGTGIREDRNICGETAACRVFLSLCSTVDRSYILRPEELKVEVPRLIAFKILTNKRKSRKDFRVQVVVRSRET
jgi:hypothetical protein